MSYFPYGKTEINHLSSKDKKMAAFIEQTGMLKRKVTPDVFQSLVSSIIAQQVSNKAAKTVHQRLNDLAGKISPKTIRLCDQAEIQQCGMTVKKAGYILSAAEAIMTKKLNLKELPTLDDQEVITKLTALPGIGVWTAEMILLHSLLRPNIFSYNDLVIRRNLASLHKLSDMNKATFEKYRKRYSPYCSVAMIYLWHFNNLINDAVSSK